MTPASPWRPIADAPRDGTPILLGRNFGGGYSLVGEGWWIDAEPDYPDQMGHDGGFMHHSCNGFVVGRSFGAEPYRYEGCQPTHWMPLPPPPTAIAEDV